MGNPVSPFIYESVDNLGRTSRFTVNYDNTTKAITSCTAFRDPASPWVHIYFGLGPDGTPNTSPRVFDVPAGTTAVSAAQMQTRGFTTITDVFSGQVTAGP